MDIMDDEFGEELKEESTLHEQIFHNNVREQIIFLLLFFALNLASSAIISRFKRKGKEDYYSWDEDEVTVYRISTWLCTFSLAVSIGSLLLLPISIISNEVLVNYPDCYYIKWLNSSLIQGFWNSVFLLSNLAMFVMLPFAYLFTESEGFFGHRKGLWARTYETFVVLILFATVVLGLTYVLAQLFNEEERPKMIPIFNLWAYLPFLYSCISFLGALVLLVCTPLGFVRLFDVVGKFLIKPQILLNLNEEYIACSIEEQCLMRRLKQAEFTNNYYTSPTPISVGNMSFIFDDNRVAQNNIKLRNGELQGAIRAKLLEVETKRKIIDKQRKTSSFIRNIIYPFAMLILIGLTGIAVLLVIQNSLSLLIGIKALPSSSKVIASGVASSPEDVALFTNCTLLAVTKEINESLQDPISEALEFLLKHEFVRLHKNGDNDKYTATALGKACLSSSIGPDEAITLFTELEKARQCFVLDSELHLIYLVTPYSASQAWGNLDWLFYLDLWEKMPSSMKRVGQLVGVSVSYMVGATRGRLDNNYHKQMVHKRFFVALVLQDLVNEVPLSEVCAKYKCNRGVLQSLQQSASTFAGMVTSFSRQLGWSSVEILLAQFQDRLQFGVSRDLLDLMRLPSLTGKLARTLYKAGLETVIQLANSDVETVEKILYKSGPFESSEESKPKNTLRTVWISGRDGLTEREAAELLVKEARSYLVCEMGLKEAKWDSTIEEHSNESAESVLKDKTELKAKGDDLKIEKVQEATKPNSEDNITKALVEITSEQSLNESESSLFESFETNALDQPISESTNSEDLISLHLSNDSAESVSKIEEFNSAELVENAEDKKRLRISYDSFTDSTPIKKSKISTDIDSAIEKCTQLSLDDITDISPMKKTFRIVDVCQSETSIQNFFDDLKGKNDISFCLICTQSDKPVSEIGGNIFGGSDSNEAIIAKNRTVHGFAFYWDEECFYLSVEKCEIYREVIAKLGDIFKTEQRCVRMFDGKEYVKVLLGDCDLEFHCQIVDPKILDWLLDVEERERSFGSMLKHYTEDLGNIRTLCDQINKENTRNEYALRACTEAVLTWHLVDFLKTKLSRELPKLFKVVLDEFPCLCDLEMNTILSVAKMEVFGMSVNKTFLQDLTTLLNGLQISIEKKAFSLAGRRFNFNSSSDVAKVIGTHSGKRTSTKKKILEQNEHPISNLVILWRKVNFTRTKTVYPLIRHCKDNRIYGVYDHHTATGRITMHEPSIQMVPKDFSVVNPITKKEVLISCRSAFSVPDGCILVSADYCQLELRILTYLSKDEILTAIMKKPGDIFTSIAAKWNGIPEEMVNLDMRHNVKQICYGIIYGMGAKTLAEHLEISIEDATVFMESFRNTYLGIKAFIANTITNCKKNGYVETILGRRRRLPGINDPDPTISGQAERQAVNTTVQGSAADLVKNAMATIERKIEFVFKKSRHKPKLVLQLHDELIYEVTEKYVEKTIRIVKAGMENSCKTFGYFPVKVKTGYSWGQLNLV